MRKMGWMLVDMTENEENIRGIQRYQRRLLSCWQFRKHLIDQLDHTGVSISLTLTTSCDPHDESDKEQTESDEDLEPKSLEEGIL
jgi:hypothetical protein